MSVTNPATRSAPPLTFNQVAQDYVATVGSIVYDGGTRNPNPLTLIADGYLDSLSMVMTLNGQYGTAGPASVDPFALFAGPVDRIEMVGTQNRGLYNLTGEFAGMFTFLNQWYKQPVNQSALVSGPGFNNVALPGTTAFTDVWYFTLSLGVKINEFEAPIGLYPVGFTGPAPRINVYFRPVNATASNPATGVYVPGGGATGPAPNGTFDVSQRGFAPIAVATAQPPGNLIRTYREGAVTINGNQQYTLDISQGAFAARIIIVVIANGALAAASAIQNIEYDYGFGMRRKVWNTQQLIASMTRIWGTNLPNWMVVLDFYTETQSMRDWVNTTAVTRPRVLLTTQGLTYGGAQNQIRFAVEEVFPYATAIAQSVR
jgi:hypothetical protein